jgi:hypothetical protein
MKKHSFKGIVVDLIGIPNSLQTENNRENILTFFLDLKPKLRLALAATFERLKIAEPVGAPPVAARPRNIFARHIPNLPAAVSVDGRDQRAARWPGEGAEWLGGLRDSASECKPSVLQYWEKRGHRYPALKQLARAVLPAQVSGAASERVWSAADDLCGGDRARLKPETLDATIKLRMDTAVRAACEGVEATRQRRLLILSL